jgi:hypothetical protein
LKEAVETVDFPRQEETRQDEEILNLKVEKRNDGYQRANFVRLLIDSNNFVYQAPRFVCGKEQKNQSRIEGSVSKGRESERVAWDSTKDTWQDYLENEKEAGTKVGS